MASPGFPLRAAADGPRRIGMPRALLHYRYGTLWTAFFEALGCDVTLSAPTDRATVARGDALSNDECCLASKIYLGHVASLVDSDACDAVFVPSIANVGRDADSARSSRRCPTSWPTRSPTSASKWCRAW